MEHKPEFVWVEADGQECRILDGVQSIASFYPGTDSLPENDSAALRPLSLHDLCLTPGGPAMIEKDEVCGPLCLSWRKHLIYNMEIDDFKVDDSNPETLKLYIKSHDTALRRDRDGLDEYRTGNFDEVTWLELSFDPDLSSYVYDVRTRLIITPGRERFVLARDNRGLEFGDILPAEANDYFPPKGNKKYTHIVYKGSDGAIYNRPQNRHMGPDKVDLLYAQDGFLAFVAEKQGNPVMEFLDGTGILVKSEICWAMYDVHFKLLRERQMELLQEGRPLEVHYRFYSLPFERARKLLEESKPDPILEHTQVRCPVFVEEEINDIQPSEEYRQPSDKWFWQCNDDRCRWSWETGYRNEGMLVIDRDSPRFPAPTEASPWAQMFGYSSDGSTRSQWEYPKLSGKSGYRICAMVRTQDVEGRVLLALQYSKPDKLKLQNEAKCSDVFFSEWSLSGTNDWTELTLETPSNLKPSYKKAGLFLVLEGKGKCWFDEVRVERV